MKETDFMLADGVRRAMQDILDAQSCADRGGRCECGPWTCQQNARRIARDTVDEFRREVRDL